MRESISAGMKTIKRASHAPRTCSANGAARKNGGTKRSASAPVFKHPKTELEAATQRYVDLFELAPVGYVSFDRVGRIEEINLAAAQLLGAPRGRLIGKPFALYVTKDDGLLFLNHLLRCRSSQPDRRVETELHLRKRNGDTLLTRLQSSPMASSMRHGARLYQTAILDITERKRTEKQLAEQGRLLDLSYDAILVLDAQNRITFWNHGARELYGYSAEEALGKVSYQLLRTEHRQSLADIQKKLRRDNRWSGELVHTRKDGSKVVVMSRWALDRDARGKQAHILETNTDITLRKQAEEELRRAMEFDEAVLQNMAEGLFTVDTEGCVTSMNRAAEELFGWKFEELRGKKMHDVTHHHHRDGTPFPAEQCAGLQAFQKGKVLIKQEDCFIRKDGSFFDVVYSSAPLKSGSDVIGSAVVFDDISERKQAEEAAQRLQETSTLLIHGGDVDALYQEILDTAIALMHSDMGSLQMFHPERGELLLLAWKGFAPKSAAFWKWVRPDSGSSCGRALSTQRRVIVPDIERCDFMAGTKDLDASRKSGIRAVQSTPLISRSGNIVGMISTHWRKPHQPVQRDLDLFDVLARQAADLIERKHSEDVIRTSEEQFRSVFNQTFSGIAETDLTGRFVLVNDRYCQIVGRSREELLKLRMQDITHPKDLLANNKRFRALARGTGKNFVIEKRYLRPDGSSVWVQNDVSGIRDRQNKVRHIVAVSTDITDRKNQETALQKSKEVLEKLIQQRTKALRVSNAELKNEIGRRQGLEGEILAVSDREQQRLGQELHDGLCQHLTAVAFMTRSVAMRLRNHRVIDASDIEKIAELVNNAAADTRELSRALHRVDVDAAGLVTALQDLVDREIWKVPCRLEVKPSFHIKDDAAAAQFYRIAREAVINANKHAQAREIVIKLERSPAGMIMHVCDDGVGFPTDRRMKQGLGYHIMNYRAQQIGARLEIDSRKGGGTRVSCCLPNRRLKPGKPDKAENSRKKRFPARIRKALTVLV